MSCPLGFRSECTPQALAAVTDLSADEAAEILWPLRTPPPSAATPGGANPYGAWPHDVGEALLRLGWWPELFDGRGVPWLDAGMYARFLRRRAHRRALFVRRLRPARRSGPPEGGWAYVTPPMPAPSNRQPAAEQPDRRLSVAAFVRTFPSSTWILFVRGHALAARGGELIEGGDGYQRYHVRDAIRVLDTHSQEDTL